jgi:NADH-quinone oxidoreductase subunit F
LLTSLEGYRGEPRLKPPFPAIKGLYGKPTVVNNVETVATLPHIVTNGPDWFAAIGTETGKGTRLWCMSGHVNRPGNYEMEMGAPIRELIYDLGGGVWKNRTLKAFQPGGASMMVLLPQHLDVGLDFDAIQKAGSLAGAGAMVVMDETTCMVDMCRRYVEFFHHESCGKCTPCREGTFWMSNVLTRIEEGEGKAGDADLLLEMGNNIDGRSFCPLGDASTWFPRSCIKYFRDEFEQHVAEHACPFRKERVMVA